MTTFDPGMPASWETENIRRLGDSPEQLAERSASLWRCVDSSERLEAYKAAIEVAVQAHGLKPVRWSVWFHAIEPGYAQACPWERLATIFHADRLEWARGKARELAERLEP